MTRTAWWVVLAVATAGWGEGAKPEFRIDTGTQVPVPSGICFVNGDRQIATRGTDGAVRIWDVGTGGLLRTLRMRAIGTGFGLAASPDGRWLAAASEPFLLAIYDTRTWRLVTVRRTKTGASHPAFTPDGNSIVTPCWPIGLELTSLQGDQPSRRVATAPEGADLGAVTCLACSPDGQSVAVGHIGGVLVHSVRGGATRSLVASADMVDRVAWLSDSRRLLAYTQGRQRTLSMWDTETGRRLQAWPVSGGCLGLAVARDEKAAWVSSYQALEAYSLADGRCVAGLPSSRNAWAPALSADGRLLAAVTSLGDVKLWDTVQRRLLFARAPVAVPLRAAGWREGDGAVGFGSLNKEWPPEPDAPIEHWFRPGDLSAGEAAPADRWRRPEWRAEFGSIRFSGKRGRLQVADRDGRDVGPSYEPAGGASWLHDGRLALCHNGSMVVVEASTGAVKQACTGVLWGVDAVAQSTDNRLLVGACSEAVLRIWPLTTNDTLVSPLLSIFPAQDGNWIAWTEEGYYACTPAAEKWIGWQINHGEDEEPDYYPAAQFREQFYRPDVIMRLLDAGSVAEAVKQADAARKQQTDGTKVAARIAEFAPPKVEILEPADGATVATSEVTVRLRVKDPNNRKVVAVIPLVNGRPLTGGRFILVPSRDPTEQQVTVPLDPGENTISAIATNDAGSHSVPVSVTVRYGAEEQKPAMYVLAVGVSAYANKDYTLRYAAKDATDLSNVLKQQEGKLFRKVEVKLLTDKDASQGGVLDALD